MAIDYGYYGQSSLSGCTATGRPSGLGEGLSQTAALASGTASGFSGGYIFVDGPDREELDADDFRIEHPGYVTFYKKNNRVALRHLHTGTKISPR